MCTGKIWVIMPEIVTEHHRREETTELLRLLEMFTFKNDMENPFPELLTIPQI